MSDAPAQTDETGDLVFDTLWKRTLEEWDDDKRHAAVLDYAERRTRACLQELEDGTRRARDLLEAHELPYR